MTISDYTLLYGLITLLVTPITSLVIAVVLSFTRFQYSLPYIGTWVIIAGTGIAFTLIAISSVQF